MFCFDRFLPLFVFASLSLSFLVLLITELLGKLLKQYMLIMWWFWVEIWRKRVWFIIMLALMLLTELCLVLYEESFQVYGLENDEMSWRMDKSSTLGMCKHPKKYPRGTSVKAWGCPRGTPSSSAKIRSPFNTLYFYCFMHYPFFLERLVFSFQFCLVCLLQ
jgi:hypothetical protein